MGDEIDQWEMRSGLLGVHKIDHADREFKPVVYISKKQYNKIESKFTE